jgi:light-regulated signal transduction histidine kinase (bacteriophytochrome)
VRARLVASPCHLAIHAMTTTSSTPDVLPWEGQPYSIKRHGTTINNCDSEPVQTPGCIQSHGALLVLRPSDLTILQVSENVERWLGLSVQALLGRSAAAAFGDGGQARIRDFLGAEPAEQNPLYVFTLDARGGEAPLDVIVHSTGGVVVVELEATGRGEANPETDYYSALKKSVSRLQGARSVKEFCASVTAEVRALSGLDRVMVYRFHEDGHGEVVAESRRADLAPWLGLHYPAEDIPKPAREVFKQIWIRPVPDVGAELAELCPLTNPDTGKPLTMTHCTLRGPSIMYTEYLQNMGVKAALTMPIRRDGELWGLIACHHYAGPHAVPYKVRAACEFFAQVVSLQHKAVEDREQLLYRLQLEGVHQQLVATAAREHGLEAMTAGAPTLLDAMDAGGAAVYHSKRWWRLGNTPSEPQLKALGEWLYARREFEVTGRPVYATDTLARDYPPAEAFASVASGLLAVPLSFSHRSVLLWFRPETIQTVTWGGNPHDKPTMPGPHGPRLTPRKSFELFVESVALRSLPWKPIEIDAASRLRILLIELVVDQAERLADLNADLSRSNEDLDAFAYVASHDLKEPLRGIHKYTHQLLEEASGVSAEHRKKLEALMRLTLRMDSLLDSLLHFSKVGRVQLDLSLVDLDEVLGEALEMVEARRTEQLTDIVIARPLPTIACDRVRVREVFVNLLSNAMKYNDKPHRRIEIGYLAPDEPGSRGEAPPEASGRTVYFVRDDGIGIQPRHHDQVFKMFRRLHGREEYGGGSGAGLTIVKKLVERHSGQIWITSTPGQGTTFFFTLEGDPQ